MTFVIGWGGLAYGRNAFWAVVCGCSGFWFTMVMYYAELPQAEQAKVVLPRHMFPLISVGKAPDIGELALATKLYGKDKKEVHRIPCSASITTEAYTFLPMFTGMLPATSLATLAISALDVKTGDWRSWGD